jgi:nucleotide-binding universal stress UspA family protein
MRISEATDGAAGRRAEDGSMKNIFERVVCGVDDSEAGHLAARLAARLADPGGSLSLVAVEDTSIAVHAGWQMAAVSTEVAGDARAALDHATELGQTEHAVTPRLLRGDPVNGLLAEIDRYEGPRRVARIRGRDVRGAPARRALGCGRTCGRS